MSKEETVEVTVKVPKGMVELFKAAQQFSKNTGLTLEKWLHDRIVFGLKSELDTLDTEDTFGINSETLIEAYGLSKIFDCGAGEK